MNEKILVTKPFLPDRKDFNKLIDEIWNAKWLTNQGPLHQRLSNAIKSYLGINELTLTVNGHLALEVALRGLRIHGEVITTPFTFASTVHSIVLCGMTPVFCDIRESDMTIDPDKIETLITNKTEAILPVHVYGHPCDTERIDQIAKKYNLKVLYDAAHAFGVKKQGHSIATYGDASIFSFHATKLFNSIEGGAIAYQDERYCKIFDMYKNFGIESEESIPLIGGNAKMNEFQAAMGLANLPYMDEIISKRKAYTLRYRERLNNVEGIKTFVPENDAVEYNYAYMPIIVQLNASMNRDQLYEALHADNIFTRKYFYPILSEIACYRSFPSSHTLPVAHKAGQMVLSLPLYTDMGLDTVDYICDCIEKHMKKANPTKHITLK